MLLFHQALHSSSLEAPATGMVVTFRQLYLDEGWRVFYRGITASFLGLTHVAIQVRDHTVSKLFYFKSEWNFSIFQDQIFFYWLDSHINPVCRSIRNQVVVVVFIKLRMTGQPGPFPMLQWWIRSMGGQWYSSSSSSNPCIKKMEHTFSWLALSFHLRYFIEQVPHLREAQEGCPASSRRGTRKPSWFHSRLCNIESHSFRRHVPSRGPSSENAGQSILSINYY